jgi:RNA-directed DNA polymerase
MIRGWLEAGVFEAGKGLAPTEEGTPQGGIISPLLLNVALHGLEQAAGVRYQAGKNPSAVRESSPVLVRYADDFVACCFTERQARSVRGQLEGWLAERGLSLNEDKTRIVHLTQGFDFLGWNFRRYPGSKLLIKPSKAAVRKHRRRLADEMRRLRGSNAGTVIATLGPIIRGWTAYHRCMVASEVFGSLSSYMWKLTWKWAKHSHPNKPRRWVTARYFGTFNPLRDDKWVFGDKDAGAYLVKHSWTGIRRHVMVKGTASPDDPGLAGYWRYRRDKHGPPLDSVTLNLLARQGYRCPLCGSRVLEPGHLPASPEAWQDWWLSITRREYQQPGYSGTTTALAHASCQRTETLRRRRNPALQPATP